MNVGRRYLIALALLAVLALLFGLVGTVAPPLAEETSTQQESSSESVGHFQNPPTYDSGWVDIRDKCGQFFALRNGVNSTEAVVDITGKTSLDPIGGGVEWSRTYGGAALEDTYSVVETFDRGYAIAGFTNSSGAGGHDFWLVKTDAYGIMEWSQTYGGADHDLAYSMIQTNDGGYAIAGSTASYGPGFGDFWLVKTDAGGDMEWSQAYGGADLMDFARCVIQTSDGGYALAGYTRPVAVNRYNLTLVRTDAAGNLIWSKTYGGEYDDHAYSICQTDDGGYALAGYTESYGAGSRDFWLVKTDSAGNHQWNKTYGGVNVDWAWALIQTDDGGYALAGYTESYGAGDLDFWLVKTDAAGNAQWNKTYGTAGQESAQSIIQTYDGGYALVGRGYSRVSGWYPDVWLVKTNSTGNMMWNQSYGGPNVDYGRSLVQTSDGAFVLAGFFDGTGGFPTGRHDSWLIKVDGGVTQEHKRNLEATIVAPGWSQTYGGTNNEYGKSVIRTADGGYAIAGYTQSFGAGGWDFWLVKTDSFGNRIWNQTYGGGGNDYGHSLVQTADGGYAIAGYTTSYGAGSYDFWLVKTDSSGTSQWSKTYGGIAVEQAYSMIRTSDGGYAIAGYTQSFGAGGYDFWLVKINSTGDTEWSQTFGGANNDQAFSLIEARDRGYAIAGQTQSAGAGGRDFWLVKTDPAGNVEWDETYGGSSDEFAQSLIQTVDGGYALAGATISFGVGGYDFWLVKTDLTGNHEWNRTYGGKSGDVSRSLVQTFDQGYAIIGETASYGAGGNDFWLVKTDINGYTQWSKTYGGRQADIPNSLILAGGGFALAGNTYSFGTGNHDLWLVITDVEMGLTLTALTNTTITLHRGRTDPYWNYVRVRLWLIKEPSWIYGDINMDGIVDVEDLYILSRNYGKTLSLLSLSGIVGILGIQTVKKRKQNKQPSYIS